MRDFLNGTVKIKNIMTNKSTFICRHCGLSHEHYRKANACCQKEKRKQNKSGQKDQQWRNN